MARTRRRGAALTLMLTALASCSDWMDWDLVFERSSVEGSRGWTGGDGAVSVPLPDGGTLWIFGDSWISGWNSATNQRVFSPNILVDAVFGTTIGVQEGQSVADPDTIRFYARTGTGAASEITTGVVGGGQAFFGHAMLGIPRPSGALLWPQGGACLSCDDADPGNDRLAIGLLHFQFCNPELGDPECLPLCLDPDAETCTVGVDLLPHVLARIENPHDAVEDWEATAVETSRSDVVWGASFVERPDGLYIFGRLDPNAVVARADVDDLLDQDAWEFWDGSAWQPGALLGTQAPAPVAENVGALFTVDEISRYGVSRYLLVHTHPLKDHFAFARPSTSLTSWPALSAATQRLDLRSIDETLQRTIDDQMLHAECDPQPVDGVLDYGRCGISYHGMAHDQISFRDASGITSLVFSYIVPAGPSSGADNADYYRPRFGFFPLDLLEPWCNPAVSLCWRGINHQIATRDLAANEEYREAFDVSESDGLLALLHGLSGNADLYVRLGQAPTLTQYDCRPFLNGNQAELCQLTTGTATRAHVLVHARDVASSFTLRESYDGIQGLAPWNEP